MKSLIFVGLVLGFGAWGSAQTAAPSISVNADEKSVSNGIAQLRGHVSIFIGDVHVTADEADVANGDFKLRGDVHVSLWGAGR
jgi:hypothetical protein